MYCIGRCYSGRVPRYLPTYLLRRGSVVGWSGNGERGTGNRDRGTEIGEQKSGSEWRTLPSERTK